MAVVTLHVLYVDPRLLDCVVSELGCLPWPTEFAAVGLIFAIWSAVEKLVPLRITFSGHPALPTLYPVHQEGPLPTAPHMP